ncbi:MAG: hypothetical protein QOE68_778 [Thermoanaerobaculia bacterium]|nr:hypothetical protein [Thermoanaerobaculia bacterium]
MENRERDKMSKNTESTSAGDVNRNTSSQIVKDKSDSSADFGQNIGRTENLNEPNSRTGNVGSSGFESSSSPNRSSGTPTGSESSGSKSNDSKMNNSKSSNTSGSSSGSRH